MYPLVQKAHQLTIQRFGKTIQLFAPLYLSNECIDTCVYCGFSRPNAIARKTLTLDEVWQEASYLSAQGFQHLLLVSGEHPKKVSPSYLGEIVQRLKPKFASILIEAAPLTESDYRTLIAAGVDGVVVYQETYNETIYKKIHLAGPKKNYHNRLQAVEEACRAGMRTVGLGVLLGLNDWHEEVVALIAHTQTLMKKYWQTEFRIGLPRLKPCASGYQAPHPVADEELIEIVCRLRLALPEVGLVLSTRERPELRNRLLKLGITHMSAGSRTEPGGYLNPEDSGKQFELEDLRKPAEVAAAIGKAGYEAVWKDWESTIVR